MSADRGGEGLALGVVAALVASVVGGLILALTVFVAVLDQGEPDSGRCQSVAESGDAEGVPEKWRDAVDEAAAVSGVPVSVLAAQIGKETGWDEKAVNTSSGAVGLTQFVPDTWAAYGEGDPLDGEASIKAMGRYMKDLMGQAKDAGLSGEDQIRGALAAYNWGPGSMARVGWDWSKGPAETTDYVTVILGGAQVTYSETCEAPAVGAGKKWDGDLGDGEWTHPLPNSEITGAGAYGPRNIPGYPAWANMHAGIDFATPDGAGVVIAPFDMRVTAEYPVDGCVLGKALGEVEFGVELCHLESNEVDVDQELKRGDVIGEEGGVAGSLGGRTVEHLHFALYDPSSPDPQYPGHQNPVIDPTPLLIEKGVL